MTTATAHAAHPTRSISPNGWAQVSLGDIVIKSDARVPVVPDQDYPNFGLLSFGRGLFTKQPIHGASSSATSLYRASAGQFVYSRLFAFEGAYGVVPPEFDGWFVSNEFPLFDCDSDRVLAGFIGWYFRNPLVWPEVARLTTGMGNRRQRIKPEALLTYRLPLPPLEEQRGIVARIDRLATKIDDARQMKQMIEDEANALLRSQFSRIADDAPRRKMADVAPLVRRKVEVRSDTEYAELGIRSFGRGTFHKPSLDYLAVGSKKLYRIAPGDLLFNNVFAWEGAIAVAQPEDTGRVGSHRFITCVPEEGVSTADFLCFYFITAEGLERIGEASPGGAGRNRTLGLEKLAEIEVPVPPIGEQIKFGQLMRRVKAMRAAQDDAERELDALLPSILDRAFKGGLS